MSRDCRHSRGVRSSVQQTIEIVRTTSAALNHHELKTWKTWARSSSPTRARPDDRVVARVDVGHRQRVVGGRPERERRQLPDRHPDDAHHDEDDDLGDREVDRRQQPPDPPAEPAHRIRAAPGDGPIGRDRGDGVP